MWQIMLTAAVAGCGILAKKLIFNTNGVEATSDFATGQQKSDSVGTIESVQSKDSSFLSIGGLHQENNGEADSGELGEGSVFKFSTTSGAEPSNEISRKKTGSGSRAICPSEDGFNREGKKKVEKKCGVLGCEKRGWVVDQRDSANGRRFSVCLKKRRTSKNASGKCLSCSSKGNSFFSWGMNVGIMYMMSTGKAEISRLNHAMNETARVVQGLKSEISRRKAIDQFDVTNSIAVLEAAQMNHRVPDAEGASSVLTEDQQHEGMEIDQLEAELETELQKLPFSAREGQRDTSEPKHSNRQYDDPQNLNSHQSTGVLPSELEQKLSHLLIEQQESQIAELESELHRTQSKLCEKETELQTLKECVKRLTEFSLGSASDEETEDQSENETSNQAKEMGRESSKSTVGMKRTWIENSYNCFPR